MAEKRADYTNLDEVDRKIVDYLREDGRMAYREISRRLDVSEGTVRKRVNKLLETGFIKILAVGDPLKLGVPVLAATIIKVSPGEQSEVGDQLADFDNVRYVALGVEANDLMVESLHRNLTDLHDFLANTVSALPGVRDLNTFQVVKIKKSVWDWSIPIREEELSHNN
ncbi:Lrp/AsnC family transcriptional regulator [Candidatus Bipolaricaulota bacterium]|nr:Lrp/AsnC family transcriptional regulator [Candidatus Bipolaricaulota bacterium]